MPSRTPSASLGFAAWLVLFAIVVACASGVTIYAETRHTRLVQAEAITHGHAAAGRKAIVAYGCGACHVIPGIWGANGTVGPDLTGVAKRATIAGALSNDPATMVGWIEHPQKLRPGTAMPEMGVSDTGARDMAAYLYSK
jgi:cytochrome c1